MICTCGQAYWVARPDSELLIFMCVCACMFIYLLACVQVGLSIVFVCMINCGFWATHVFVSPHCLLGVCLCLSARMIILLACLCFLSSPSLRIRVCSFASSCRFVFSAEIHDWSFSSPAVHVVACLSWSLLRDLMLISFAQCFFGC